MLLKIKSAAGSLIKKMRQLENYPITQLLAFSMGLIIVLEILSRRSILKGLGFIISNPFMFLFNVLIILFTLSISMMTNRKRFLLLFISFVWLGLGVTNFVLLSFRTTPLTAMDFYLLKSVFGIINVYLNSIQLILIIVISTAVLVSLVFLWKKFKKNKILLKKSLILLGTTVILMILVFNISLKVNALTTKYGNIADAYSDYGFAYCFSNSLFDQGINEPAKYSEENIDEVLKKIDSEPTKVVVDDESDKTSTPITDSLPEGEPDSLDSVNYNKDEELKKQPNIIIVQLETFIDVNRLRDFTFSENPTPNFSKLKEDYSSGFITVPSIGAGTANTEFEILTGMNLQYFGAGEYPYKTILQSTTSESICYNLDEIGYHSHAIHNNTGTFYDRNKVFQKLGFDSFSSIEYMNDIEYNPVGWAKDKVLTTEILKTLDTTETSDFIFTISVQPHGKYPETVVDDKQRIKVIVDPNKNHIAEPIDEIKDWETNKIEEKTNNDNSNATDNDSVNGNQDNNSSDIINNTNTNYNESKVDESKDANVDANVETNVETNVVNSNNDEITNKKSDETQKNVTDDKKDDEEKDIDESYKNKFEYYANQLYETDQFVGELIGKLTTYQEPTIVVFYGDHLPSLSIEDEDLLSGNTFQTEYVLWSNFQMEEIDVDLNAYQLNAYVLERLNYNNGVLTKFHQRYIGEPDYQEELELLQYDMLYGARNVYGGINPFIEKEIQMGIQDIKIDRVIEKGDALFIEGDNFTPWSVVYFGEKSKETLFIDENTLIVPYQKITDVGIYIAQVTDNNIILSQSKEWVKPN
jgi:phosphoglycerol transferase MdoB-like AlkP superfamily enzyme